MLHRGKKIYKNRQLKINLDKLPSGREYCFSRYFNGHVGVLQLNATAICNYPVQGFATADLLPMALVLLDYNMRGHNLKSVICNTVHDSIVIDVHPDEYNVLEIIKIFYAWTLKV